jgi:hypothetical protein
MAEFYICTVGVHGFSHAGFPFQSCSVVLMEKAPEVSPARVQHVKARTCFAALRIHYLDGNHGHERHRNLSQWHPYEQYE